MNTQPYCPICGGLVYWKHSVSEMVTGKCRNCKWSAVYAKKSKGANVSKSYSKTGEHPEGVNLLPSPSYQLGFAYAAKHSEGYTDQETARVASWIRCTDGVDEAEFNKGFDDGWDSDATNTQRG